MYCYHHSFSKVRSKRVKGQGGSLSFFSLMIRSSKKVGQCVVVKIKDSRILYYMTLDRIVQV